MKLSHHETPADCEPARLESHQPAAAPVEPGSGRAPSRDCAKMTFRKCVTQRDPRTGRFTKLLTLLFASIALAKKKMTVTAPRS